MGRWGVLGKMSRPTYHRRCACPSVSIVSYRRRQIRPLRSSFVGGGGGRAENDSARVRRPTSRRPRSACPGTRAGAGAISPETPAAPSLSAAIYGTGRNLSFSVRFVTNQTRNRRVLSTKVRNGFETLIRGTPRGDIIIILFFSPHPARRIYVRIVYTKLRPRRLFQLYKQ